MATLDQRLETYKTDGFTIFEKVLDETQMDLWKQKHQELSAAHNGQTWFGNTLELAPELMLPAVSHPTILRSRPHTFGVTRGRENADWQRT